jgi:pyruvate-formate lyase-activating enzyme
MEHTTDQLILSLEQNKPVPCFFPWTQLEERSVDGDFKVCCWNKRILGTIPKNSSSDIMNVWRSDTVTTLQQAMIDGSLSATCPPSCPILGWRWDACKDSFYKYDSAEYATFSSVFTHNRHKVIRSIIERTVCSDAFPLRLKLHPSDFCNLRCPMCDLEKTRRFVSANKHYYQKVYRLMPYLEELKIFGGEPFACEATREIILGDEIRQYPQLHFSTITNGTMLDTRLLQKLRHLRLGWFEFSLDSCTAGTYHKVRGLRDVAHPFRRFEDFVRQRDIGALRIVKILASFVIQQANLHEIGDFVRYAKHLGVAPVFSLVFGSDELLDRLDETRDRLVEGIAVAASVESDDGLKCLSHLLQQFPAYCDQLRRSRKLTPSVTKIAVQRTT